MAKGKLKGTPVGNQFSVFQLLLKKLLYLKKKTSLRKLLSLFETRWV